MTITLAIFIFSFVGIVLLLGMKVYALKTNAHPVPNSLRRYIKRFLAKAEERVEVWLQYFNKKTFQLILYQIGRLGDTILSIVVTRLKDLYDRAARTQRRLRGKNNSSSYLHEVIAHKKENGHKDKQQTPKNKSQTTENTPHQTDDEEI